MFITSSLQPHTVIGITRSPILEFISASIDYNIKSSLIDDIEDSITEINGELHIFDDNDDEVIVAKCKYFFIDMDNSDVDAFYLLDSRQQLEPFICLYEMGTTDFTDSFIKLMNEEVWNSNLLIIDRIEILPDFRGKGLAERMINDAIKLFSATADIVVLKPFPLQFEYKDPEDTPEKWEKMMQLDQLNQNELLAKKRLSSFYQSLGFKPVEDGELMVKLVL